MLVLRIFLFWEEDWTLDCQSYVIWQVVSHLVFTSFISNNHVPFHLFQKKHLVRYLEVPKYYEHGCKFQKWYSWYMILLILTKFISLQLLPNRIQKRVSKSNSKKLKKNKTVFKDRYFRFQTRVHQNVSNEVFKGDSKF